MHRYWKAIGFNDLKTKKQERELLESIELTSSCEKVYDHNNEAYCEYNKLYGENIGIKICGQYDENKEFIREYHFPYFFPDTISSFADILLDSRKDGEYYLGISEDVRLGVSLIYYVQNIIDYKKAFNDGRVLKKDTSISLAGLALKGRILLPIRKTKVMIQNSQESTRNRMMLASAAKKGDHTAIEALTIDEMNTYSDITKRIQTEDVFSIVDTYLIPHGIEGDEYSIMGEIKNLEKFQNEKTKVYLYHMLLEVNEMNIELCVPVDEVLGEPEIGRRFKGTIWLQGKMNFPE